MDTHDIFTEYLQRVHGICFSVHDQIGRIQVNSHITFSQFFFYILDRPFQCNRRLLSCLKEEILAVFLTLLYQFFQTNKNTRVVGIIGIFRHIPHMGRHIFYMDHSSKPDTLLQHLHTLKAERLRHKSQGKLSVIEIPYSRAFPAAPECCDIYFMMFSSRIHLIRILLIHDLSVPAHQLAALHPHGTQLRESGIYICITKKLYQNSYSHKKYLSFF